ncbi:MAG: four helix bundle protein [Ginsengibacter sp.]
MIWQKGIKIVKKIYVLAEKFSIEEKFLMISQITIAAVSIPTNIGEGSSRNSDKDYARFLQLSLGSAFEVQTYLILSKEMNWVKIEDLSDLELLLEEEIKMIHRFINTITAAKS